MWSGPDKLALVGNGGTMTTHQQGSIKNSTPAAPKVYYLIIVHNKNQKIYILYIILICSPPMNDITICMHAVIDKLL